jgi:hypothetical protein
VLRHPVNVVPDAADLAIATVHLASSPGALQPSSMLSQEARLGLHGRCLRRRQALRHLDACRRQSKPVARSSRTDSNAAIEPQSAAASVNSRQQNGQQAEPKVECVATGMDVQCYISDDESTQGQQHQETQPQPQPAIAGFPSNGNGQPSGNQHIDCVATGMDVQCFISDDDDAPAAAPSRAGAPASTAAPPPKTAAAAAASGEGGTLMQLLGAALLVSPFFFWGTSMVAMKVSGSWGIAAVAPGFQGLALTADVLM